MAKSESDFAKFCNSGSSIVVDLLDFILSAFISTKDKTPETTVRKRHVQMQWRLLRLLAVSITASKQNANDISLSAFGHEEI